MKMSETLFGKIVRLLKVLLIRLLEDEFVLTQKRAHHPLADYFTLTSLLPGIAKVLVRRELSARRRVPPKTA